MNDADYRLACLNVAAGVTGLDTNDLVRLASDLSKFVLGHDRKVDISGDDKDAAE